MKIHAFLFAVAVLLTGSLGDLHRAEAQRLYRGSGEQERALGVFGGYLPGGPVKTGFGGIAFRAGRFDVGYLYSRSPDVSTFGVQVGGVPRSAEERLYARVGANAQVVSFNHFQEPSIETVAGGVSMTVGLPLQGETVLFQPTGAFGLSVVPDLLRRNYEPEVVHSVQSAASASVVFGLLGDGIGVFFEPLLTVPISTTDRTITYGVGATLLFSAQSSR